MLPDGVKKLFTNRVLSATIFFLACVSRVAIQVYNFFPGTDRSFQLVAAKNLLAGDGITVNQVLAGNLSRELYLPLAGWPPGYSFFVGIIAFFFNNNVHLAALLFDVITILIFVYFSRRILITLGCSANVVNLFTLVVGFFVYPFSEVSTTDSNALAFFICAFSMTLDFIKDNKKGNQFAIGLALINFISPFLRYMFIPLSLVIPLYLLYIGKKTNDKRVFNGGLWAFAINLLLLGALLIFQIRSTGAPIYINPVEKGYFPSNLLHLYPVIVGSFINIGFYYSIAASLGILDYGQYSELFQLLSALVIVLLVILFVKFHFKKSRQQLTLRDHYVYIGGLISLLTLLILITLSLRYGPSRNNNSEWTYVIEPRYVAFITIFLQQLVFIFIFDNWQRIRNRLLKLIGFLLLILLGLETIHGLYFTSKILITNRKNFHANKRYSEQKQFIKSYVLQLKKNHPSHDIVFFSRKDQ
ncbi:MAG: hypothetical protein ACJ748_15065, partial [Flavisolibacter sp.]